MRSIVVGAAGQIGRALVKALVQRGDQVAALDRDETDIADEQVFGLTMDVRDRDDVDASIRDAAARMGGLDVLINSAGIMHRGRFVEMAEPALTTLIDVNLAGSMRCARAAAEIMGAGTGGSILNIASVHGLLGMTERAIYAATKGGVIAMSRALAAELGPLGITVNVLAPGPTGEGMGAGRAWREAMLRTTPSGTPGRAEDIAAMAAFLTGDHARNISGQVIALDGGLTATDYSWAV